jgi:hypothetical protein
MSEMLTSESHMSVEISSQLKSDLSNKVHRRKTTLLRGLERDNRGLKI